MKIFLRGRVHCLPPAALSHSALVCFTAEKRKLFHPNKTYISDFYFRMSSGQMLYQQFHLTILRRPWEAVRNTRPEVWREHSWSLHKDTASAHRALLRTESFSRKTKLQRFHSQPTTLISLQNTFFLFPKLKVCFMRSRSESG